MPEEDFQQCGGQFKNRLKAQRPGHAGFLCHPVQWTSIVIPQASALARIRQWPPMGSVKMGVVWPKSQLAMTFLLETVDKPHRIHDCPESDFGFVFADMDDVACF